MPQKYWIIVASKDHARRGVEGGFCMANHGKKAPLLRLQPGDGLLIYSPKITFAGKEACQAFTAVGRVGPGPVEQGTWATASRPIGALCRGGLVSVCLKI